MNTISVTCTGWEGLTIPLNMQPTRETAECLYIMTIEPMHWQSPGFLLVFCLGTGVPRLCAGFGTSLSSSASLAYS